jgi:hypothetical protein
LADRRHARPLGPAQPDQHYYPDDQGYRDNRDYGYDNQRYQPADYGRQQAPPPDYGPANTRPGYGPRGDYGPPPPPKKKHTGLKVTGAVMGVLIVVGIISSAAGGSSGKTSSTASSSTTSPVASHTAGALTNSTNSAHPPTADVAVTACSADDLGDVDAKVVVTNHSSKTSNYLITIAMTSRDGATQIDTGNAVVNNLAPGQATAPQDAMGSQTAPAGGFACKVAQVDRYSSTG